LVRSRQASSDGFEHYSRDDNQRGARFRARLNRATTLYAVGPRTGTTMQSCASAAKLRSGGPILPIGMKAKGLVGNPPPRTVIGIPSQAYERGRNCRGTQPPVRNRLRSRRLASATRSRSTFRGKRTGNCAWVSPGWDDTRVVQPDGCGQARRGWKGGSYPLAEGSDDSLQKLGPPFGPPLVFRSYRARGCRSRASNCAFFALVFEVALRVTAPLCYA
jgi:hypothetical protein